ncbi:hypothetical protein Ancab_022833 [Ancistrocladus abbreviatus]
MWDITLAFVGVAIVIGWSLWWWNELWYVVPLKGRCSKLGAKLPPGHMGLPFLGEKLVFFWYFNILRHPDDFINFKRRKYGDNVGIYRSHLYKSPIIIACSQTIIKRVAQSSEEFILEWPTREVLGPHSISSLHGDHHKRIKRFIFNALNSPESVRRIALLVQRHIAAALQSWAQKGRVKIFYEMKKVSFVYLGKYIASFEAGPELDTLEQLISGLSKGHRAHPRKIPGTAYDHALQCRKRVIAIFMAELEKRRSGGNNKNDIMDQLMQMKDGQGDHLSDEEVVDNIITMIYFSAHSMAHIAAWSLYFLYKFPHTLQKLRDENMKMSMEKHGEYITGEDVSKLNYTNKVVKETLRLSGISSFFFRTATDDINLEGYMIPKGWKVLLFVRYIQTDSENYEDPLSFNPDRWDVHLKKRCPQVPSTLPQCMQCLAKKIPQRCKRVRVRCFPQIASHAIKAYLEGVTLVQMLGLQYAWLLTPRSTQYANLIENLPTWTKFKCCQLENPQHHKSSPESRYIPWWNIVLQLLSPQYT